MVDPMPELTDLWAMKSPDGVLLYRYMSRTSEGVFIQMEAKCRYTRKEIKSRGYHPVRVRLEESL